MPSTPHKQASYGEAGLLVAISFGWFIYSSLVSVAQDFPASWGFSDSTLLDMAGIELLFGTMALLFLRSCGYQLRDLLPTPSWRGCLEGAGLYALALAAWTGMAALLPNHVGGEPIDQIVANSFPSLGVVVLFSMLNGLYEETFLLGYLVRGFASSGASFAIGLSVLVRLLYHLYQGPAGALSVAVYGVIVGVAYWRTGRLWPAVFAHMLADVIALA